MSLDDYGTKQRLQRPRELCISNTTRTGSRMEHIQRRFIEGVALEVEPGERVHGDC